MSATFKAPGAICRAVKRLCYGSLSVIAILRIIFYHNIWAISFQSENICENHYQETPDGFRQRYEKPPELFLESEKNCHDRLKGAEMTEKAILEIFSDYT